MLLGARADPEIVRAIVGDDGDDRLRNGLAPFQMVDDDREEGIGGDDQIGPGGFDRPAQPPAVNRAVEGSQPRGDGRIRLDQKERADRPGQPLQLDDVAPLDEEGHGPAHRAQAIDDGDLVVARRQLMLQRMAQGFVAATDLRGENQNPHRCALPTSNLVVVGLQRRPIALLSAHVRRFFEARLSRFVA